MTEGHGVVVYRCNRHPTTGSTVREPKNMDLKRVEVEKQTIE